MQVVRVNEEAAREIRGLGVSVVGTNVPPPPRSSSGWVRREEAPLWGLQLWSVVSREAARVPSARFLAVWGLVAKVLGRLNEDADAQEYLGAVLSVLDLGGPEALSAFASGGAVQFTPGPPPPRTLAPGVVVRCVAESGSNAWGGASVGGKLRVRSVSEGYDPDLNVQFPRAVREAGAFFVVDELVPAAGSKHYRTRGRIRPLLEAT